MSAKTQLCDHCRFFLVAHLPPGDDETVMGECRRYPPPHRSKVDRADVAYFPFVSADDWCGEWKSPTRKDDQR